MMFSAKSAVPTAGIPYSQHTIIDRIIKRPITLIHAPPGYMPTEQLASVLVEHGLPITWLRIGTEDRDPATYLLSLIHAAQSLSMPVGRETQKRMKQYPGGIYGWVPLFELFAQECQELLPRDCEFVLDGIHHLGHDSPVIDLLTNHFLALISKSRNCIVNTHSGFNINIPLHHSDVIGIDELQLDPVTFFGLNNDKNGGLSKECIRRLIRLSQGRPVVVLGVLKACRGRSGKCIEDSIDQAKDLKHMLFLIARTCLLPVDSVELQALALTLKAGYFRNDIFQKALGNSINIEGPWLQSLQDDWKRVYSIWTPSLRLLLHHYIDNCFDNVCKLAMALNQLGAIETAVPLFITAKEYEQAAQVIEERIDELMSYGQWGLLNSWLEKIPQRIVNGYPWLAYAQGEIRSMYGHIDDAHRIFNQISRKHSNDGKIACRSFLAESVLTARQGNQQQAYQSAQSAYDLSKSSNLNQEEGWASYQLGILAGADNKPDLAQNYFANAIQLIKDPVACDWLKEIKDAIKAQENLKGQYEEYARQLKQTEKSQQEISKRLSGLLHSSPDTLPEMLSSNGWLGIPLAIKFPYPNRNDPVNGMSFIDRIDAWLQRIRQDARFLPTLPSDTTISPLDLVAPLPAKTWLTSPQSQEKITSSDVEPDSTFKNKAVSESQLTIYALGSLQVLRDKQFVVNWPSRKAQLIFKYLLLHRHSLVSKETLMEVFWPEADLESARRNLHQAIYTLRQTLKSIEHELHLIEFENEGYRINPLVNIWLDFEVFEQHCKSGQSKEHGGSTTDAMAEYSLAEELYQDNLFSDDPYEDWTQPYRQYYWQLYLSGVAKLTDYYCQKGDFSTAISIAQRILHKDRCQEFAYQILMRCFHGQGQRQLALYQYELCRQTLMDELEIKPSGKTTQLFLKILNE